ncbi:MAG: hypothetical protein ACE5H8_12280, partial [Alphaproteobacteria bacterium]
MPGVRNRIRTTGPRNCYDACGIVAIHRDGAIAKIVGDPGHPVSQSTSVHGV